MGLVSKVFVMVLLVSVIFLVSCARHDEDCNLKCDGPLFVKTQINERFGLSNYTGCLACHAGDDGYIYGLIKSEQGVAYITYNWTRCVNEQCWWEASIRSESLLFNKSKRILCSHIIERSTSIKGCPEYNNTVVRINECLSATKELRIRESFSKCGSNVTIKKS